MVSIRLVTGALFAAVALSSAAGAATVVDFSPEVVGGPLNFGASNRAQGQNFLVQFTLASATTLKAGAIYSNFGTAAVDRPVIVKFRNDVSGSPDTANLYEISTTLAAVDTEDAAGLPGMQRLAANFGPIAFAAGTYWFGMSGDDFDTVWSLNFRNQTGANPLWQLSQNNLQFSFGDSTDAAFALYDTAIGGGVPEPSSWAMLIAGFGLTGAAMRRRAARASVAA